MVQRAAAAASPGGLRKANAPPVSRIRHASLAPSTLVCNKLSRLSFERRRGRGPNLTGRRREGAGDQGIHMSLPQTSFPHLPIFSLSGPWPTNQAIHNCLQLHFPGGATGKELACQCRRGKRLRFHPWVGKIPWRRAWQPTAVFLGFPGGSDDKGFTCKVGD